MENNQARAVHYHTLLASTRVSAGRFIFLEAAFNSLLPKPSSPPTLALRAAKPPVTAAQFEHERTEQLKRSNSIAVERSSHTTSVSHLTQKKKAH